MIMQEQVFSIEEAAQLLKVNPMTIRRMIKRNELQATQVGRQYRIPASEVNRLLGKSEPKEDK
jgi:excisionase family DNA binding protein